LLLETTVWKNWKAFCSPPGYACTNSPLESFNATIKRDFTYRRKLNIFSFINKSFDIIRFYSIDAQPFALAPKPTVTNIRLGKAMACWANYKKLYNSTFMYKNIYKVELKSKNCSCKYFMKLGYCAHLLGLEELYKKKNEFVNKPKRGRAKNAGKWFSKE
jgi:hypothetical protein